MKSLKDLFDDGRVLKNDRVVNARWMPAPTLFPPMGHSFKTCK
jgi:hypothetical protein